MHSLDIRYLDSLKFLARHASTIAKIGEFKGKQELFTQQTPETLNTLVELAKIESTESSNRIEGITAPHKKIEDLVLRNTNPGNRPEQEIAGYRDALDLIHESGQYMDFSNNIILQLHSIVYRHLPEDGGKWKTGENEIVEKNQDGTIRRIRFLPVKAFKTPEAMNSLVKGYDEAIRIHYKEHLFVIPLAILDFLCVHPFQDGNGRVGRLLVLLLLYHAGYEVGRYISLERVVEESKETYYEALEKSSLGWHEGKHDPFPWLEYFWGMMIKAYKEFEERVGTVSTGKGSKTDHIISVVKRKIGPFSVADIQKECHGISVDLIRKVLGQLKAEGVITLMERGRYAKWILREGK